MSRAITCFDVTPAGSMTSKSALISMIAASCWEWWSQTEMRTIGSPFRLWPERSLQRSSIEWTDDSKKIKECVDVAQTVQFARLRRWDIYRSHANWTVCATSAAVSSFIQSTSSSGKRCSKLFVNALNETGGNLSQVAEGLRMSLLGMKKANKSLGIR